MNKEVITKVAIFTLGLWSGYILYLTKAVRSILKDMIKQKEEQTITKDLRD